MLVWWTRRPHEQPLVEGWRPAAEGFCGSSSIRDSVVLPPATETSMGYDRRAPSWGRRSRPASGRVHPADLIQVGGAIVVCRHRGAVQHQAGLELHQLSHGKRRGTLPRRLW